MRELLGLAPNILVYSVPTFIFAMFIGSLVSLGAVYLGYRGIMKGLTFRGLW